VPPDKPARRLEDIIENAPAMQRYVTGMDLAAFEKDQKTYDAVECCLERISEAAAKLGDLALSLVPGHPCPRAIPRAKIRVAGRRCELRRELVREPPGE
jgi:hypothetical protein